MDDIFKRVFERIAKLSDAELREKLDGVTYHPLVKGFLKGKLSMLSFVSSKHGVYVSISGISGDSVSTTVPYDKMVDSAIDELYVKCREDHLLLDKIAQCTARETAYYLMSDNLAEVTKGETWLRDAAGISMCRRVLYLLHPNRFGFETYGWIH